MAEYVSLRDSLLSFPPSRQSFQLSVSTEQVISEWREQLLQQNRKRLTQDLYNTTKSL